MEFPEEAGLATKSAKAVTSFRTMIQSLMSELDRPVADIVQDVLERSGYIDSLEAERTVEAQGRLENLQELVGVAQEYQQQADEPSLSSFLQEISLYSDQDAIRGEASLVTLMTLHNAKGLEFRAVFMIGMEEGIFPHARSIEENSLEEERRLAYVGLTRARERLTLLHSVVARAVRRAELQPAVALPGRAPHRARRARAARAGDLVCALARAGDRSAHERPDADDGRLGPARHARRGRGHADRGRRRRHGAVRRRRHRATPRARLRAA